MLLGYSTTQPQLASQRILGTLLWIIRKKATPRWFRAALRSPDLQQNGVRREFQIPFLIGFDSPKDALPAGWQDFTAHRVAAGRFTQWKHWIVTGGRIDCIQH